MLKYLNTQVTFSEVPDEITLCINITGCKIGCKNCHSSYLAEDIGKPLNLDNLVKLIEANQGITCIAFMGGDASPATVDAYASMIKYRYPNLKVAWYSGRQELNEDILLENFDFIKLGPYIEELGPLNSKTTNQKMYEVCNMSSINEEPRYELIDITYKFREHEINN